MGLVSGDGTLGFQPLIISSSMDTHWRNSMKPARFFMLDARAAWPVLVMLLHMRIYTMVFAVLVMALFYVLEQRGLSFFSALRALRVWIVTKKRPNYRPSDMTRMVDFGFEPLPERLLNEKPTAKNNPSESGTGDVNRGAVSVSKKA